MPVRSARKHGSWMDLDRGERVGGGDRLVDVGLGVRGRDEVRLILAARQIDAARQHLPEEQREERGVGPFRLATGRPGASPERCGKASRFTAGAAARRNLIGSPPRRDRRGNPGGLRPATQPGRLIYIKSRKVKSLRVMANSSFILTRNQRACPCPGISSRSERNSRRAGCCAGPTRASLPQIASDAVFGSDFLSQALKSSMVPNDDGFTTSPKRRRTNLRIEQSKIPGRLLASLEDRSIHEVPRTRCAIAVLVLLSIRGQSSG
jgi:hypothetical protein